MTAQPKLFDQLRNVLRVRHYSYEIEKSYLSWIKRFIVFHHMTPPRELGAPEVEAFLTHLAVDQKVGSSVKRDTLRMVELCVRSQNLTTA